MNEQFRAFHNQINSELDVIVSNFNNDKLGNLSGITFKKRWHYDSVTEFKTLVLDIEVSPDAPFGANEEAIKNSVQEFNRGFLFWQQNYSARANFAISDNMVMEVLSADVQLYRKEPPTAEEVERQLKLQSQENEV